MSMSKEQYSLLGGASMDGKEEVSIDNRAQIDLDKSFKLRRCECPRMAWVPYILAPWSFKSGPSWGPTIKAGVLEMLGTLILSFVVVGLSFLSRGTFVGFTIQNGVMISIVHAAIYLAWGWWTGDFHFKRHLNPTITLGYSAYANLLTLTSGKTLIRPVFGLLATLMYLFAQFLGATFAALLLNGFGLGMLPNPSATAFAAPLSNFSIPSRITGGTTAFTVVVILGIHLIVAIAQVYNDMRHQDRDNDYTNRAEPEYHNRQRTVLVVACVILFSGPLSYAMGVYHVNNPAIYWAGSMSTAMSAPEHINNVSNPVQTDFIDWLLFLLGGMLMGYLGGIIARLISIISNEGRTDNNNNSDVYSAKADPQNFSVANMSQMQRNMSNESSAASNVVENAAEVVQSAQVATSSQMPYAQVTTSSTGQSTNYGVQQRNLNFMKKSAPGSTKSLMKANGYLE